MVHFFPTIWYKTLNDESALHFFRYNLCYIFNPTIQLQMERFWIAPLRLLAKLTTCIPLDLTDFRMSDAMSPYVCLRDVSYITQLLIVTGIIISCLGMKSWDLHVCDRASTITHVDRVKKSNPWYNKIWLCLNVTIWSSQICFSVIFIHFVMIQNIWEKNCTYSHFFQSPVTASAYFWSALKAC